jgi:hypothetical protein
MSYLLQTNKNKEDNRHYESSGDIVVSEDFRAVYFLAPDGSRRRIKDVGAVVRYVTMAKDYLAKEEQRRAEEAEQARVLADTSQVIAAAVQEQPRPKLSPAVAALLIGGLAGMPSLPGRSNPLTRLGLPEEAVQ